MHTSREQAGAEAHATSSGHRRDDVAHLTAQVDGLLDRIAVLDHLTEVVADLVGRIEALERRGSSG